VAAQQGEVDTFRLAKLANYDTDPGDKDLEDSNKAGEAGEGFNI
jgi:hypothetical protein